MSFATTLGHLVGRIAATTYHAGASTFAAAGHFAKDVASSTKEGHADHSARLATLRGAPAPVAPKRIRVRAA